MYNAVRLLCTNHLSGRVLNLSSLQTFIKTVLCYCTAALAITASSVGAQTLNIASQDIYITKICEAIVSEALATIDIKTNVSRFPTARGAILSNSGNTDGEICRIKEFDKSYQNLIRIEPSIAMLEAAVFTNDINIPIETNNWQALKPYILGTHIGHLFVENATQGFDKTVRLVTDEQLVKMLASKRLEAVVMIKPDALKVIKELGLANKVTMLEPVIASYPLHFFIHKKNARLETNISKAIKNIVDSGRAATIYQNFIAKLAH